MIGSLECLTREGSNQDLHAVILHGFGADASDLFPLADYLDPEGEWSFTFPNAPLEVPIGGMFTGRGWFPISLRDLGQGVDFTKVLPPGLDSSADLIKDLIFHLNAPTLVLGGFSQGAMIGTEVALQDPQSVHVLVIWSGSLLDEPGWKKHASALKGKRVLQSHGTNDPVIPYRAGQRLNELLKSAGSEIEMISFAGGHEIPMPVLAKSQSFFKSVRNA